MLATALMQQWHEIFIFEFVQAARLDLISNKQRLEEDIRVKENSLKIDQQKCMTLRYTDSSVLKTMKLFEVESTDGFS
jgi:hypothetical protein